MFLSFLCCIYSLSNQCAALLVYFRFKPLTKLGLCKICGAICCWQIRETMWGKNVKLRHISRIYMFLFEGQVISLLRRKWHLILRKHWAQLQKFLWCMQEGDRSHQRVWCEMWAPRQIHKTKEVHVTLLKCTQGQIAQFVETCGNVWP